MRNIYIFMTAMVLSNSAYASGKETFEQQCSACHQKTGEGIPGAFPALKNNDFVNTETTQLIDTILYGRAGMPSFKGDLNDEKLFEVISYIKTSWGNEGTPVTLDEISSIRSSKNGHTALSRQD